MTGEELRQVQTRLDEALAIFAEQKAQFSGLTRDLRDNVAKLRADVAALIVTRPMNPWRR